MKLGKGADSMTNVLVNANDIMDTYEEKDEIRNKKLSKIEKILLYLKIKNTANSEYAQNLIKKYIGKNKEINSGRATILGTRVTPEDIVGLLLTREKIEVEDITKEFPSIENNDQIMAGLMYYFSNNLSLLHILFSK